MITNKKERYRKALLLQQKKEIKRGESLSTEWVVKIQMWKNVEEGEEYLVNNKLQIKTFQKI